LRRRERERGRRSYTEGVETKRVRERKSFEVLRVLGRGDIFLHFKWNSSLEETSSNWNLFLLKTSSNFECPMPCLHVHAGWQKFKWNSSLEEELVSPRDEFTKKAIPLNCFKTMFSCKIVLKIILLSKNNHVFRILVVFCFFFSLDLPFFLFSFFVISWLKF
jgi:hypothetical protein